MLVVEQELEPNAELILGPLNIFNVSLKFCMQKYCPVGWATAGPTHSFVLALLVRSYRVLYPGFPFTFHRELLGETL